MKRFTVLLLFGITIALTGCINNENNEFEETNSWIRESMQENYLWNELVPEKTNGVLHPGTYFGSLLAPNDFFSYIIDDADLVIESDFGVRFNTGASPFFGKFSNSNRVFSIIEYVYPNSSADSAGLQRGDIIIEVNDIQLSTFNFLELFYSSSANISYTLGETNQAQTTIVSTGEVVNLIQEQVQRNPVVYTDVIEEGSSKIGYLFYAEFLSGENDKYLDSVDVEIQNMKAQGVTDLIVDLRYNPGGDFSAAENLANVIVAPSAAQNEEVFVRFQYNDIIQQRITEEEGPDSQNLVRRFAQDPDNLGLNDVYFLTTNGTAFTSELLINGLIPHMNVTLIGEPTSGELFGSTVIRGKNASPPVEFSIVPINLEYENAEGATNLVFGLQPDVEISNDLLNASQIGDINDPALDAAIDLIAGRASSSKVVIKKYKMLEDIKAKRRGSILFDQKNKN